MEEISPATHVRAQTRRNGYFLKKMGHFFFLFPERPQPKRESPHWRRGKCKDEEVAETTAHFPLQDPCTEQEEWESLR